MAISKANKIKFDGSVELFALKHPSLFVWAVENDRLDTTCPYVDAIRFKLDHIRLPKGFRRGYIMRYRYDCGGVFQSFEILPDGRFKLEPQERSMRTGYVAVGHALTEMDAAKRRTLDYDVDAFDAAFYDSFKRVYFPHRKGELTDHDAMVFFAEKSNFVLPGSWDYRRLAARQTLNDRARQARS